MHPLKFRLAWPVCLCAGLWLWLAEIQAGAQTQVPADVGTVVNGYQDDFDGTALAGGWQMLGANVYSVSGGSLHVSTALGDPNHLLYTAGGYNNSVQEVLARIRVSNFGTGDQPRGGVAVCVDPAASPAGGIDCHFRDVTGEGLTGRHLSLLDDLRAWQPTGLAFAWQNNTWYWLRLRHDPNAASLGAVNDVFAKIWPADGSAAEPAGWQDVYDYTPGRSARTGYAGIVAGSTGGTSEFEVDYVLIKASGLPGITVAPAAFPLVQTPVVITTQPQNQTVTECQGAAFNVVCSGTAPYTFQWYRDGAPILGATAASYSLSRAQLSDDNAVFRVVAGNTASNVQYSATSSNAVLRVAPATARPALLGAANNGLNQVLLSYSIPVSRTTATNLANYQISGTSGSLPVLNAVLAADQLSLTLSTSGQIEGVNYTVTVNNITDDCTGRNALLANSQATFQAAAYASLDIGNPTPAGGAVAVTGGYNITGGGADIGGTNDHFQFSSQPRTGDFDLKVRLDSLGLADAWSEAGLMARESTAPGSRFAAVLATPTISGAYFQSRATANGAAAMSGSFPVNYPNTWLRLQRNGSQFTGYAGFDGQNWTSLGTVTLALPATLSFGFAVASHNGSQVATAAFRDLGTATVAPASAPAVSGERLAQSSRLTSLVISEIMYHPGNTKGTINTNAQGYVTNSMEFVELFNTLGTPEDISGFRLSGSIDYRFPAGTVLSGGGFLVVARSPADIASVYGLTGVLGPYTNSLPNNSGTIRLRNRTDAIYLEVNYGTEAPWPIAADGAGHSLVLARPSYGEADALAWAASDRVGGSPGRLDPVTSDPLSAVVLNEFLAHSETGTDFIELYNAGNQPLDLGGASLSDDADANKFVFPASTVIPARGFVWRDETELGFSLKAEGETIYFRNAAGNRVLDVVRYEAQGSGVSFGRFPNGAPGWGALAAPTPGSSNAPVWQSDIVINEIMYHPISQNDADQFVELYNRGAGPVSLAGWKFTSGINFTFGSGPTLNPGGYLVVARNAARLAANYQNLGPSNLVGDFSGKLSHNGERVALARPDLVFSTNTQGGTLSNLIYVVANEVSYGTGGRWGQWADGGGSSLELRDPRADNSLAASWADSDETAKAPWTIVSNTGLLDNGNVAADQLQVVLQGAGECLIDDVEVLNPAGANQIANPGFETDAAGWTAEGTEAGSGWESSGGYNSAHSYHVRAVDRGDNQINRIRTPLLGVQGSGTTVTIRAKVRWLRGRPDVLFRLRGNWLEAVGRMNIPLHAGTPGARNSRALNNAPPAISDVAHHPVLPAANQACVVTARATDPDGPSTLTLRYRLDPSASYQTATMVDNGSGDDAVAGDGIYTATIPAQAAGSTVAFYVQAADKLGATSTFPDNAPARECLVRFGELQPSGNFPVYRIWMTQATLNTWNGRSKLDNTPLDVTFVLGSQRVIYNTKALYAGSPYIAPGYSGATSGRCGYSVIFPADDRFLGNTDLVLDWPGGHGNENTAMQEQMGYWIAERLNLPTSHRYIIRLHVNGVTDEQRTAVFEAVNQPAGDFIRAWSPDDNDGDFYKIDRGFEFNDGGGLVADPMPTLQVFTTTGGIKKEARYRWNWNKRSTDAVNNHTNVFLLVDALNAASPEPYTAQSEGLVDTEEWMGIFAVEHVINNFDAYGHDIGKNMYAYKPEHGKWQLYMFDLDWLMLAAPGGPGNYTATSGPLFSGNDPVIIRMYNHPPFRRAYFRAIQDAVDGPLASANCDPVMDAKYSSLIANGVPYCDGQTLGPPTAVKNWFSQRRAALLNQLALVASPFTISGPGALTVDTNLVTLSGTAPITVKTITFNGVSWPIAWTSVSNWTIRLPVGLGTTGMTVTGYNAHGQPVAGASNQVTVTYNGPAPEPAGSVVFNEIMYHPTVPGAEFIELFNTSSNFSFDLSGWKLHGLDYTFHPGSYLAPRGYMVLAKDRTAATIAYGTNLIVFDEYAGNLQSDGETLTLLQAAGTNPPTVVVDKVRYEPDPPWPGSAAGAGSSLQLNDAAQDNARVSNWADGGSGWRFFSYTGLASGSRLLLFLENLPGDVYIDDLSLVAGSVAGAGQNLVLNGDFEGPLTTNSGGAWVFFGIGVTNSAIVSSVAHSGQSSLHLVCATPGGVTYLYQDIAIPSATYTVSYWYLQATNDTRLTTRVSTAFRPSNPMRLAPFTPGAANSTAGILPPYPPVWINEVLPQNVNGLADHNGQQDPWIELVNTGPSPVSLDGWFLANNYTNLAQWSFPAGATLAPGEFKVIFVDGDAGQSTPAEWHAGFRLEPGSGSIALCRPGTNAVQVVDYINYREVTAGRSYGSFPDGQPFARQEFFYVTAGGTNNGTSAPITVSINEWMASNTQTVGDPATTPPRFDDWFELYNPGLKAVDLTGYYLTDDPINQFQFRIPPGYTIAPHGFLLVWADNEPQQNSSNRIDLHVNFQLNKSGESIALFAADGSAIDVVQFGPQTNDVSQGRAPDGSANIIFLPAPTPGGPNVASGVNHPPALAAIGDRSVHQGQILTFTASATDPEAPQQILVFSLDQGAPAGATINAATGAFTWPTAGVPAPSTNRVTVRVTDNGVPSLSDFQTIGLIVLAPPGFFFSRSGSQLTLAWPAIPGHTYRVEYADNLGGAWLPFGGNTVAGGASLSVTADLSVPAHRFFRIVALP